ncbi:unnamed protein product, partial [Ixodes persulcatus]
CHRNQPTINTTTPTKMTHRIRAALSALCMTTLLESSSWSPRTGSWPRSSSGHLSKRTKGFLQSHRQLWLTPSPQPWEKQSRRISKESLRPSPDRPASPHQWQLLEDSASMLLRTPNQPTPPRPPTPGNWEAARNTNLTRPPTPLQQQLPSLVSPGSSPPSLRPPTPGAFLCRPSSPTTLMGSSTHRSPGDSECLPSTIPRRSATSRRLSFISNKSPETCPTSEGEKLPSSNCWSATSSFGTVAVSGSPPATNCGFSTASAYFTMSRSPGGEPPLRATRTPPPLSSLDHQSRPDDQRPPKPPLPTEEPVHPGLVVPTPAPRSKPSPPRNQKSNHGLDTNDGNRAFPSFPPMSSFRRTSWCRQSERLAFPPSPLPLCRSRSVPPLPALPGPPLSPPVLVHRRSRTSVPRTTRWRGLTPVPTLGMTLTVGRTAWRMPP